MKMKEHQINSSRVASNNMYRLIDLCPKMSAGQGQGAGEKGLKVKQLKSLGVATKHSKTSKICFTKVSL